MATDAKLLETSLPKQPPETLHKNKDHHEKIKIIATAGTAVAAVVAIGVYLQNNDLPGINKLFNFLNPPAPQTKIQSISAYSKAEKITLEYQNLIPDSSFISNRSILLSNPPVAMENGIEKEAKIVPWSPEKIKLLRSYAAKVIKYFDDNGFNKTNTRDYFRSLLLVQVAGKVSTNSGGNLLFIMKDYPITLAHEAGHGQFMVDYNGVLLAGFNEGYAQRIQLDSLGWPASEAPVFLGCSDIPTGRYASFAKGVAELNDELTHAAPIQPTRPLVANLANIYHAQKSDNDFRDVKSMSLDSVAQRLSAVYGLSPKYILDSIVAHDEFLCDYDGKPIKIAAPNLLVSPTVKPTAIIPPRGKTPTPAQQRPK